MECRKFQIALLSAQGLENVREKIQNESLRPAFNPRTKRETPVDKEGETDPAWNFTIRFTIGNQAVEIPRRRVCHQAILQPDPRRDRYIGEVSLSFKDLFDGAVPTSEGRSSGIWVKKPSRFLPRNLAAAGFFIMKVVLEATLEQASISTFHSLEKMFRYVNEHDKYIELKS
ncbi:hypothetical protein CK203_081554 [Vitis vinifera]|uniref:C2 domain-containing protein n=1 Tax=Vitis vinifera TaxID=29760 RepID=A0A438E2E9_VITVI|nr:hypothetical protein CK203_081554 [Vitis vinifera]